MVNVQTTILNVDKPGAVGFGSTPDLPVAVWANRDAIIAKLDAKIDEMASDKTGLDPEAHQRRIAELQRQLLDDAERPEAHLVHLAREQGLPIEHRADVHYLAMLVTIPPAVQSPGTSRQHAITVIGR